MYNSGEQNVPYIIKRNVKIMDTEGNELNVKIDGMPYVAVLTPQINHSVTAHM